MLWGLKLNILEQINKLKVSLKELNESTGDLPEEIKSEVDSKFKTIRDMLNNTGFTIEKYFKDQRTIQKMSKDILNRMDELEIYKGISSKQKNSITEKIIEDKDLTLIGPNEVQEFIEDQLKTDSDENLIKKAYSKKDIIYLGEAVNKPDVSEVMNYDAGLKILKDMVKTPTGRRDAIAQGIKRLAGNVTTLQYYLMLYYGI